MLPRQESDDPNPMGELVNVADFIYVVWNVKDIEGIDFRTP